MKDQVSVPCASVKAPIWLKADRYDSYTDRYRMIITPTCYIYINTYIRAS